MKAVILAGGKGTRGKPYTEFFPKAMTPINGRPIIDYIVKYSKLSDYTIDGSDNYDELQFRYSNFLHSINYTSYLNDQFWSTIDTNTTSTLAAINISNNSIIYMILINLVIGH